MGGEVFEVTDGKSDRAIIKVIGVGGGGCNTVNQMVESGIDGVDFVCANTDRQHLERCKTNMILQLGQGLTYSVFVQDDVELGGRASLNAGVLLNRDSFAQHLEGSGGCPATIALRGGAAVYESDGDTCTFLRFGFADEIQPRLGIAYQVREGSGDKAYASWGRYYNMDQKSSGRSLAPARIFQTQTVFDRSGNVLSSGPLASTTGKMIDPDLEPIFSDELVFGYAMPIGDRLSLMNRTLASQTSFWSVKSQRDLIRKFHRYQKLYERPLAADLAWCEPYVAMMRNLMSELKVRP